MFLQQCVIDGYGMSVCNEYIWWMALFSCSVLGEVGSIKLGRTVFKLSLRWMVEVWELVLSVCLGFCYCCFEGLTEFAWLQIHIALPAFLSQELESVAWELLFVKLKCVFWCLRSHTFFLITYICLFLQK